MYRQGEEADMLKPGQNMTEGQIDEFIRRSKDIERMSWEEITEKLKDMGYKSRRTGKFLTEGTVRFRYYMNPGVNAGASGQTTMYNLNPELSGANRTLDLIKTALKMKTDDRSKLAFIQQIVEQQETS